ncbi:MAG: hypothetical protein IPL46_09365 [Saprospiraceae bacterium]|nr:hypothetical protein [Saprospiraceae bacterium]
MTVKNIQLINALPILQQASEHGAVYYENDPHLNPYGQKLLGEHVVDIVEQNQSNLFF